MDIFKPVVWFWWETRIWGPYRLPLNLQKVAPVGSDVFSLLPHPNTKVTVKRHVQSWPFRRSDRETAFVHCTVAPNIITDVTGVEKFITEIRSDLDPFLAGSLYIGEHQTEHIRRCWRKLHQVPYQFSFSAFWWDQLCSREKWKRAMQFLTVTPCDGFLKPRQHLWVWVAFTG